MKLENIGIAFSASLLVVSLSGGIAFGANTATGSVGVTADAPPELQSAQQRVELSKAKLEQAKQQLSAAKAMLKAADAEFRAARADQEALSLRTQARKLADASGLQEAVSTGNRLYPANFTPQASPSLTGVNNTGAPVPAESTVAPLASPVGAAGENADFNGQAQPVAGSLGAPTP